MEKVSAENNRQYVKLKLLNLILINISIPFYFANLINKNAIISSKILIICLLSILMFMYIKDLIDFYKDYKKGVVEFIKPHTIDVMSLIVASSCLLLNLLEFFNIG